MASQGLFQSIWNFIGGEDKNIQPSRVGEHRSTTHTTVANAAPPTAETMAVEDLEREMENIEARIRRIQNDITKENACIRAELAPYAKQPSKMPSVAKINVQSRIYTRKQMEAQLRKLYVMRTKLMTHIYSVESAGSQKMYTAAVRNTLRNGALFASENDIHMAEDTIEQQREIELRQREMDHMISYGANIDEDDEELEEEMSALFASTEADPAPLVATRIIPSTEQHPVKLELSYPEPITSEPPSAPQSSVSNRYRSKELTAFEDIM
jgi:uncharacterized protein (DUF1778 family)